MYMIMAAVDVLVLLMLFGVCVGQSDVNIQINVEAEEEVDGRQYLCNIINKANLTVAGTTQNYDFSIFTGDYGDNFVVATNSDLFLNRKFDREEICGRKLVCEIMIQIGATSGTVLKVIDVLVTVLDRNDNAPVFSSNVIEFSIPEGTALGSSYELPSAKDLDVGNFSIQRFYLEPEGVSFGLEEQKNLDGTIALNLVLNLSLDRELWDNYQLYVKAVDGGNPRLTGMLTVNINVTDINDNRPSFNPQEYNVTIDEDIEEGTGIINVTATDRDIGENARLAYSFTSMEPPSIQHSIKIREDTGEIYLQHKFDSETGPFTLYVEAKDHGNPVKKSKQARVVIHVRDINDNYPFIQVTMLVDEGTIPEHTKIGTPVAHIRVTDADTGLNGEAVCSCNNTNFSINPISKNNFRLDVAANFDRELQASYLVTVNCSDKGEPSLSVAEDINITIGDINDHLPAFIQSTYYANVSENNEEGAVLLRVSATDLDEGINAVVEYKIKDFEFLSKFSIGLRDGIIKAIEPLNREDIDFYNLTITANNPGQPDVVDTTSVIIRVLDTNDHAPDFNAGSYAMSVMENAPNGTSAGYVAAEDLDLGDNARISYMITTPDMPFKVLDDGTVVTTQKLDREVVAKYEFEVVAMDHGSPPLQTSIPVFMRVGDVNDNAPYLDFPYGDNDTVTVAHTTSAGSVITRIIADDTDAEENKMLVYSIFAGNDDQWFKIDPSSGDIRLAKDIESGEVTTYSLTILVKDQGTPPLETRATLRIKFYMASGGAPLAPASSGQRNVLIAVIISCVTFVLSIIIITVICVIRRKDHQKDLYNSKAYDEQRIMPDLHRNSNRSSSSRGSQDKMITSDTQYMENGFQAKKGKKEVSFSLDDHDGVVSMETMSNGHFDPVSTFKSPSPMPSEVRTRFSLYFSSYQPILA